MTIHFIIICTKTYCFFNCCTAVAQHVKASGVENCAFTNSIGLQSINCFTANMGFICESNGMINKYSMF